MSGGRLFQSRLPAAVKARSPTVTSLVVGMMTSSDDDDRRRRRSNSAGFAVVLFMQRSAVITWPPRQPTRRCFAYPVFCCTMFLSLLRCELQLLRYYEKTVKL